MSQPIILKRSNTPSKIPLVTDLQYGEVAVNYYDGKIFTKINNGSDMIIDLTANQNITVSGDATGSGATSIALTLANSGVSAGTYNSGATSHVPFTIDAKGRVTTTGAAVTITPAWSSITATPTTIAGYGLTDAQAKDSKLTSISALSGSSTGLVKLTNGTASFDSSTYLTANQTVTLSGDVTGSGSTAITATIAANSVTLSKMANMASASLIYRKTAGSGSPEVNSLATLKTDLGLTGTNSGDQTITLTGDVTGSGTGSFAATLANTAVTAGSYGSTSTVGTFTVDGKGRLTAAGTATITPASIGAVATTSLGANSGVATLDAGGKLTSSQIPSVLVGAMVYQGTWNAATNSPTLVNGTGTKGQYYKVGTTGSTTIDGISQWNAGDMIAFDGTTWDKIDGLASEVLSVAGRTGAVTLSSSDISGLATSATTDTTNASNISSGTLTAARLPAFTGDATTSAGSSALTLAASGVAAGTYDSGATQHVPFTVDAKGRITSIGTAVTIAPAFASITSTPTTLSGYGITDAMSAGMTIDGGSY